MLQPWASNYTINHLRLEILIRQEGAFPGPGHEAEWSGDKEDNLWTVQCSDRRNIYRYRFYITG